MGRQYLLHRPHRAAEKPGCPGGTASDFHHLPVRHRHRAGGAEHPAVPETEPGGAFPGAGHFLYHGRNPSGNPGGHRSDCLTALRPCRVHHGFAGSPQGGGYRSRGRRPVPARNLRQKHPLCGVHFLPEQPGHRLRHRCGALRRRLLSHQLPRHQRCPGNYGAPYR